MQINRRQSIFMFFGSMLALITGSAFAEAVCQQPKYEGFQEPLSDLDKFHMKNGKLGCEARYPRSPCLKKVEKVGANDYKFTCTQKVEGQRI